MKDQDVALLGQVEGSIGLRRGRKELRHQVFSGVDILCSLNRKQNIVQHCHHHEVI